MEKQLFDNTNQEEPIKYNNSSYSIVTPILLALFLVLGFFAGRFFTQRNIQKTQMFSSVSSNTSNKLFAIFDVIKENYVDSLSEEEIIEKSIPEILAQLDPHSVYIPAQQMQAATEPLHGKFEGIGVQFNLQNDTIVVIQTISGGPSEKVGIMAGDRIVTINDSVFAGVKTTNENIIKHLKGEKGSKVKVGIKRKGFKDLLHFNITRDEIPLYSVDVAYMVDNEIGYVKVSKFAETTYDEFIEAVEKLKTQGMKKIILDLRGNGGGYMSAATGIADEFLEKGKMIVYTEGRFRPRQDYKATSKNSLLNIETVVLIDAWSASASEIVAGALQDNDIGTIVGQRTFGKGLVQESMSFPDGSGLRITTARYYTPTGRSIQKPYGKNTDYEHELSERYMNGEFMHLDSTHFVDSLKFTTPKGKVVYGGGGIAPDVFVPRDTTGYSHYFGKLVSKGVIYQFAFEYADNHRKDLIKYKTGKELNTKLEASNLMPQFIAYAEKKGISTNTKELAISRSIINTQLKAYIARNIIDNDGFYPIIQEIDNVLNEGIKVLRKK